MIKIERNLEEIALLYLTKLKECKRKKQYPINSWFIDKIDELILAKPDEFNQINEEFEALYYSNNENVQRFRRYMDNQYKTMCDKHGYWLAKELNVNTCPYCNRQYTFTTDKKKKIRPQFDHFFSKSKYPHLALSFYNLIPCCPTCNHVKSDHVSELLHPYFEGYDVNCRFSVNHREFMLEKDSDIKVSIDTLIECDDENFKIKCKNNIRTFALKELYQEHTDYIEEIILKTYSYNQEYYNGLIEDFSRMGKSTGEIHRLIFGNYIDRASNEQRPLSKLTSDILEQIGLQKYSYET
ncbi:hypothetical protein LZQ00_04640 [Sphingobacterium sp. SRCM116780]|uniref:hypothetical protein n=1 Tax=Sphingobacterium sp. SRCM116780 TaxID=2907623 RepID=UPI001F1F9BCD|nr:hypothetical protein [Sphingobacterium sp. SRCM116780]UIR57103.1 hypothetical protein LZQ00_04640 [Sphingobacterium sp. SRCM116780]